MSAPCAGGEWSWAPPCDAATRCAGGARGLSPTSAADPAGLTVRERQVLDLLGRGHSDREIAARLSLSVGTVGHHVAAILCKTGAGSRRELRRSAD